MPAGQGVLRRNARLKKGWEAGCASWLASRSCGEVWSTPKRLRIESIQTTSVDQETLTSEISSWSHSPGSSAPARDRE